MLPPSSEPFLTHGCPCGARRYRAAMTDVQRPGAEAWVPQPLKFRTPWEWSLASSRALGTRAVDGAQVIGLLNQLGQPTWKPESPAGYDDIGASWAGPDAVMRRVEAARRMATRTKAGTAAVDARQLAAKLFPASVSPATAHGCLSAVFQPCRRRLPGLIAPQSAHLAAFSPAILDELALPLGISYNLYMRLSLDVRVPFDTRPYLI